jgi:gamma-glutamyl:cysteine ligase YbdK (ATP-grasp superfamily)
MGALNWSNELVLHVIELKTGGPAPSLEGLAAAFQSDVARINAILEPHGARLMPTAMHPWMNPHRETRLWPHDFNPIYEAYHRIFDCRGHGWSNLQATHVNLPFCGDDEFGRLHAAIRVIMPLLPALAASSPICDGAPAHLADARLEAYRHNADRVPMVAGRVIPEPVFTFDEYHSRILTPLYKAIAPHDPEGTLQEEWLNARGAIARFERNTFEIRVLDIQECPAADIAMLELIVAVLRGLCDERWSSQADQRRWAVDPLAEMLLTVIRDGDATIIDDSAYVRLFGVRSGTQLTAGALWKQLLERTASESLISAATAAYLRRLLHGGTLARRIMSAVGRSPDGHRLRDVYRLLCDCLAAGEVFHAAH